MLFIYANVIAYSSIPDGWSLRSLGKVTITLPSSDG